MEQKIIIPTEVEHAKALFCPLIPPAANVKIDFTRKGESTPFRTGTTGKRRVEEIAAYMFCPRTYDDKKEKYNAHLKKDDIISVTIGIYKSYTPNKDGKGIGKFGELVESKTQDVKVT